ncbi:cardiolipin synthase [uncultured Sphaerochaeta sp.]|uniref:cardiolipin synthase n=1 Tax=uncultured Sphaerochaeta sp. TaxID=886478 RepID=UPI002A0A5E4A|nr:cardiolipin synthase [uncultured Sphaerochaeta sp.]
MRKLLKFLTGRLFISIILVLFQIGVLVSVLGYAKHDSLWIQIFSTFSIVMALYVVTSDVNPAYKIGWMLIFMIFPLYGGIFYFLFGNRKMNMVMVRWFHEYNELCSKGMEKVPAHDGLPMKALASFDSNLARQGQYIANISGFPLWGNTEVQYFPSGEDWVLDVLEELKKAREFIFLEFFIIGLGEVWNAILAILLEKKREGLTIFLMFDDVGSMVDVPSHYERKLRALGLDAVAFNPMGIHVNSRLNSRDHRKVLVIDGNIGYTGGVNIADQYANRKVSYGHWKDTAVKLKGDAVWNLSVMFLQLWSFSTHRSYDFSLFRPTYSGKMDGFVQPFGDSPLDNQNIAENAYIQIINMAKDYVWITTPYLVLDNEMITALKIAAQSGVDVRIITPHIPDKWYVFAVTRDNYKALLEAGVRIFEYTPGFIHAKMFVSDDKVAIIGTINMDYRSFFLHFENGILFYGSSVIKVVSEDVKQTFELSEEITLEYMHSLPFYKRIIGTVLRLAAPLL